MFGHRETEKENGKEKFNQFLNLRFPVVISDPRESENVGGAMTEVSMCSSASSTELTPEEERIMIRDIALAAEANSKEGDNFYLITQRFFSKFLISFQSLRQVLLCVKFEILECSRGIFCYS